MASSAEREWMAQAIEFLSSPVPEPVLDEGVLVLADVLSAAVAGADTAANERVATGMQVAAGNASIVGTGRTASPGNAALVNGTTAISAEIEEGHNRGGHVGAGIVAGGFALGEAADADGESLLEGIVKAYELCTRIEHAIWSMKDRLDDVTPWHLRDPHGTWTTVGPAVAGAIAMGCDDETVVEAFRLGANLAVLSMHDPYREGSPARNVTSGLSTQVGVNAALLADAGLAGSRAAIREVYDPLREMDETSFDRSFGELGEAWSITENYYKFTPSCWYTHAPLAALDTVVDDVRVDEVESIDVFTYNRASALDHTDCATPTSGKFSTPYVLARKLIGDGADLWLDDFDESSLSDPATRALADRVGLHRDPEYEDRFPDHRSARVEVTHTDGTTLEAECVDAPGDHRNFPGNDALEGKFERLLETRLDAGATDALEVLLDVRHRSVRDVGAALRTA
ncbi:MmgE/PrpD family protein [Natronomonas marina]|uniref:MmgE/PrpD family protein n=1 Tax=Natronomonas marina TaxID=2961939 RepID=UPI0020C966F7|nr:MmgE/PrpD family protein [Natronomonas marina]